MDNIANSGFNPRARVGRDITGEPKVSTLYFCFNPRARVGRDSYAVGAWRYSGCFNPRARVGATSSTRFTCWTTGCFNPRARVGRD